MNRMLVTPYEIHRVNEIRRKLSESRRCAPSLPPGKGVYF
jgi:hypothetical protein